jgi:hypothetical protein
MVLSNMKTELFDYEVNGLAYRRRAEGIHEFYFRVVTTASVDAWFETLTAIERNARVCKEHVCSLYHVEGLWPTPYATQRIIAMTRQTLPTLFASTAILLNDNAIGIVLIQGIIRQIPTRPSQNIQIFFQEADALQWLQERKRSVE